MEINSLIKVYDDILPNDINNNLLDFCKNHLKYEESKIINPGSSGVVNFDIRRTYVSGLDILSDSMSSVHWGQFLSNVFWEGINKYKEDLKILDLSIESLGPPSILKYENTGFYTWHTDHCKNAPRTLSCVFMINDDYVGGELCFKNPDGSEEKNINTKKNRCIIWPSNFMYPHTVKPVLKGIRYSVVAWAI